MRRQGLAMVLAALGAFVASPRLSGAEPPAAAPGERASGSPAAAPAPRKLPQTAPATRPSIPIHPILTQTSFVVDPSQISGDKDLAKKLGPITVTLNYYDQLPGLDLDKLSPARRQRVLDRANHEPCTCGCKGDTVARCLVNDPSCRVVKPLARQIYEEERVRPEAPPK